jgi:hypothetical protein
VVGRRGAGAVIARVLVLIVLATQVAHGQPSADRLRDGNAAATAGDWTRVLAIVDPLFRIHTPIPRNDLAEAHRLAGLAAYFLHDRKAAEDHFLSYLQIDLDGRLDPTLYPPDVVTFFQDVQIKHAAELRARRPTSKRYWLLNLIPPGGQIQNGDTTKAIIVGSLLGGFAIANVTTYALLRSWCSRVTGDAGGSVVCDDQRDRTSTATQLRIVNVVSGVGLIATYLYGVYDGVHGYQRQQREQRLVPYVAPTTGGSMVGIAGHW